MPPDVCLHVCCCIDYLIIDLSLEKVINTKGCRNVAMYTKIKTCNCTQIYKKYLEVSVILLSENLLLPKFKNS